MRSDSITWKDIKSYTNGMHAAERNLSTSYANTTQNIFTERDFDRLVERVSKMRWIGERYGKHNSGVPFTSEDLERMANNFESVLVHVNKTQDLPEISDADLAEILSI